MQYALVNSERREAFPGGRGECPICAAPTSAKCGPRIVHHWAHTRRQDCDPWWENETQWHRDWKGLFPESCREVAFTASNGEVHRADVVTQTGIVIEFQHSAITDAERSARETFYGNMIWIVDGCGFRKNFDIYHYLPDPESELAQDLRWFEATRPMKGATSGIFWRPSENIGASPNSLVLMHFMHEIEDAVNAAYRGHHQYDWVKPRRTWLDSACPVYIDFGDDFLVKLETYGGFSLKCVRLIGKRKLVHDAMTEVAANAIGTTFYSLL
jgi:competence protein CoiA